MDESNHINEADRQFQDPNFYKYDSIPHFCQIINSKISELLDNNLIPHNIAKFIKTKNVAPGSFYLLTEVHKQVTCIGQLFQKLIQLWRKYLLY